MDPRQLRHSASHVYRRGGGTRPEVALIEHAGRDVVIKDFSACDPWFAATVGRLLAGREWRALGMLREVRGVPGQVARPDPLVLLLEHVNGRPVLNYRGDVDWQRYLEKLHALVVGLHRHGVAHGDLRSPHNVLIDEQGDPWVVDFVSASFEPPRWNFPLHWVHGKLCAVDMSGVAKLNGRLLPNADRSRQQGAAHDISPKLARFARAIGQAVRRVARYMLTR